MAGQPRRPADAGLTLVEVLVVLVLVGVLSGMVAISAGRLQAGPGLDRRAETLAARLTIAAENAATTGQDAAFMWEPDSYRFFILREAEWLAHDIPELGTIERLGSGARLGSDASREGSLLIRADLAPPDPAPFRLSLSEGDARVDVVFDGLAAQILFGNDRQ